MGIHQVAKMCGTSVRMIEKHNDKFLHSDARAAEQDRVRVAG